MGDDKRFEDLTSPCHNAVIWASLGDGVLIGSCSVCHEDILRLNPRTFIEEWLDGASAWTDKDLRPVVHPARVFPAPDKPDYTILGYPPGPGGADS